MANFNYKPESTIFLLDDCETVGLKEVYMGFQWLGTGSTPEIILANSSSRGKTMQNKRGR